MEKEFDIEIKEVLSRVETVKAESLDDAINKAMDMYYSEQIVLDAEDMKGVDFSPYSEEQLPSSFMGFSLLSASEFLQTEKWRCAKQ